MIAPHSVHGGAAVCETNAVSSTTGGAPPLLVPLFRGSWFVLARLLDSVDQGELVVAHRLDAVRLERIVLRRLVRRGRRRVAQELDAQPAEEVVHDRLRDRDVAVLREAMRLEPHVRELADVEL